MAAMGYMPCFFELMSSTTMYVVQVLTKDDSDSEGDGQDELAEASFDTVLQVIDAPEDSTAAQKFERETFIWQTVPASRGFDVISRDAMYAEMTRDAKVRPKLFVGTLS